MSGLLQVFEIYGPLTPAYFLSEDELPLQGSKSFVDKQALHDDTKGTHSDDENPFIGTCRRSHTLCVLSLCSVVKTMKATAFLVLALAVCVSVSVLENLEKE